MLKKFVACKNQFERFRFFANTKVSDWTEEEFNAIAEIANVTFEADADVAQKYMKLHYTLQMKATQIA
ncbi:MAG: hypothetical protein IJY09_07470 [Lachnospiraceae bacterium]|nr:hypothetical protein [Lachnospiraceae bacterium]